MKTTLTLVIALLLSSFPVKSGDAPVFQDLFNGKDLTGWVDVNTSKETWSVKDGLLVCKGLPIGVMVTLRGDRMWEFLDRLITLALPRVRDFKGVSPKGFDGRGNYTLGMREQIIFPEIDYDRVDEIKGMNISFVTTANTDEEGRALLRNLGMPFRA